MKLNAKPELTENDLVDLLSTAFFGNPSLGCDYTPELVAWEEQNKEELKDLSYEEVMAKWLFLNSENTIEVDDPEEDKVYFITLQQILDGYSKYLENPYDNQIYIEDMDLIGADCVIQYAVFGEVIYG